MGRDCGDLALWAGLSVGAETILVPESTQILKMLLKIESGIKRGKHSIVMVAEGCMSGHECAEQLTKYINVDARVSVLGHIQRGGSPSRSSTCFKIRRLCCRIVNARSNRIRCRYTITNLQQHHLMKFSIMKAINSTLVFMT